MSCSNKNNNSNQKSCQRYYNNNAQTFTAGSTTQLTIEGTRVVDSGISIQTNPMNYEIVKSGLYHVSADVVFNATTAGVVTVSAYMDGVQLPCTIIDATLAEGYTSVHTETDLSICGCCCVDHTITFVVNSVAAVGEVSSFCSGITKLA